MTASGPQSREDSAETKAALIESIYRLALEPLSYDTFMGRWDSYVAGRVEALAALGPGEAGDGLDGDPDLAAHFEIAARILAQATPPERVADAGPDSGGPRLLIDAQGRIVWTNGAAATLFDLPRWAGIERLNLPPAQAAALEAMGAPR